MAETHAELNGERTEERGLSVVFSRLDQEMGTHLDIPSVPNLLDMMTREGSISDMDPSKYVELETYYREQLQGVHKYEELAAEAIYQRVASSIGAMVNANTELLEQLRILVDRRRKEATKKHQMVSMRDDRSSEEIAIGEVIEALLPEDWHEIFQKYMKDKNVVSEDRFVRSLNKKRVCRAIGGRFADAFLVENSSKEAKEREDAVVNSISGMVEEFVGDQGGNVSLDEILKNIEHFREDLLRGVDPESRDAVWNSAMGLIREKYNVHKAQAMRALGDAYEIMAFQVKPNFAHVVPRVLKEKFPDVDRQSVIGEIIALRREELRGLVSSVRESMKYYNQKLDEKGVKHVIRREIEKLSEWKKALFLGKEDDIAQIIINLGEVN